MLDRATRGIKLKDAAFSLPPFPRFHDPMDMYDHRDPFEGGEYEYVTESVLFSLLFEFSFLLGDR